MANNVHTSLSLRSYERLEDVIKSRSRYQQGHCIKPTDALCCAPIPGTDDKLWISTPNSWFVPEPPLHSTSEPFGYFDDGQLGAHEFYKWPQPWYTPEIHSMVAPAHPILLQHPQEAEKYGTGPWTQSASEGLYSNMFSDPEVVWFTPVRSKHFVPSTSNVNGPGALSPFLQSRLRDAYLDTLRVSDRLVKSHVEDSPALENTDGFDHRQVLTLGTAMHNQRKNQLERIITIVLHVPATWHDQLMWFREFQRVLLDLRSWIYWVHVVRPRLYEPSFRQPFPVLPVRGLFTPDINLVTELFRVGIPVWYIRDITTFTPSTFINRVKTCLKPARCFSQRRLESPDRKDISLSASATSLGGGFCSILEMQLKARKFSIFNKPILRGTSEYNSTHDTSPIDNGRRISNSQPGTPDDLKGAASSNTSPPSPSRSTSCPLDEPHSASSSPPESPSALTPSPLPWSEPSMSSNVSAVSEYQNESTRPCAGNLKQLGTDHTSQSHLTSKDLVEERIAQMKAYFDHGSFRHAAQELLRAGPRRTQDDIDDRIALLASKVAGTHNTHPLQSESVASTALERRQTATPIWVLHSDAIAQVQRVIFEDFQDDHTQPIVYFLPPIHLFYSGGEDSTILVQKLHNWLRIRSWCYDQITSRDDVLMTTYQWRVALEGHYYLTPFEHIGARLSVSHEDLAKLPPPPREVKRRRVEESSTSFKKKSKKSNRVLSEKRLASRLAINVRFGVYGGFLPYEPLEEVSWGSQRLVGPDIFSICSGLLREVVWELSVANFRCEILDLDRTILEPIYSDSDVCLAARREQTICNIWNGGWARPNWEQDVRCDPFSSGSAEVRFSALKQLAAVMSLWPGGGLFLDYHWESSQHGAPHGQAEFDVFIFYARTFHRYKGRAPILPQLQPSSMVRRLI